MKKNAYVQFTGKLPKELKGMKLPIFGKVEKKIGKTKVVVKPRYKRFEVSVAITELTEVDYDTYQGKAKKTAPKPTAKKPVAKKTPPVKKEKKADIPTSKKNPVLKVVPKATNEMKPCETKSGITKAVEKAAAVAEKPMPLNEESLKDFAKKEEEKPYNWAKTDPINKTPEPVSENHIPDHDEMAKYLDDQDSPRGGAIIWGVVALIIAAGICAYIYLH